jgi:uncharacterized protein (TIGR00297 family)
VTLTSLAFGFVFAAGAALLAYRLGTLTRGGAAAATAVGGLTFGAGGVLPGVLLMLFFVTSSVLSRLGTRRKGRVAAQFEKGGQRDQGQVLANGAVAAVLALAYGITQQPVMLAGLAGALAAVNADTWATEIGVLSRRRPRLVTTGQPVDPGTSGAVSTEGMLAAAAGAGLIGTAAGWGTESLGLAAAALAAGFIGAAADSVLGATVQAIYFCPTCQKQTERHPRHTCGSATMQLRGWSWLGNDGVNLAASLVGACVAAGLWILSG